MEALQLRLLEKQLMTKKNYFGAKGPFFLKKCYSPKSVYWYQCFNVWKMVGAKRWCTRPAFHHRLTLLVHVSQKYIAVIKICVYSCIVFDWPTCNYIQTEACVVVCQRRKLIRLNMPINTPSDGLVSPQPSPLHIDWIGWQTTFQIWHKFQIITMCYLL